MKDRGSPRSSDSLPRAEDAPRRPGWRVAAMLTAILAIAAVLRISLLRNDLGTTFDSDEAIVGLMARHILRGELPVFFYGQHYMGSAEAFLMAGIFAIAGPTVAALKGTMVVLSLGCIVAMYLLATALWDSATGLIAASLTALPPVFLGIYCLKARGGYVETLLLGTLILWLVAKLLEPRRGERAANALWVILGLLSGLAWWTSALSAVYLAAAGMVLLAGKRRAALKGAAVAAPAFVLGGLPFWVHNLRHGFPSFGNLRWVDTAEAGQHLKGLVTSAWPILAGARGPWAHQSYVPREGLWLLVPYLMGLSLYARAVVVSGRAGRGWPGVALPRLGPALASAMLVPLFCYSAYGAEVREPRYLLPLYTFLPLIAAVLVRELPGALWQGLALSPRRGRWIAAGILISLLALQTYGCFAQDRSLMLPISGGQRVDRSMAKLLGVLEKRGITDVYTDYWICYRLAFESGEEVKCATFGDIVLDRYPPYVVEVRESSSPAFVLMGSVAAEFEALLERRGVSHRKESVGVYTIFSSLSSVGELVAIPYPFRETSS